MVRIIWRGWASAAERRNYYVERVAANPAGYRGCISCGPVCLDMWGMR
jgi:hypothetical protein